MKQMSRIQVKLPQIDHTALKLKSVQRNRTLSEELEEALVDLMSGDTEVEQEPPLKSTALTISSEVLEKFEAYCKKKGRPVNAMLRMAVSAKLRTQPEIFAAIDALKHKHRHSNSLRPDMPLTKNVA